MEEESREMHSDDDKGMLEKNKKRIVKTRAQVQELEKFYNEHNYPTESMKMQLAQSIGLTEKQVSGWFCHRRLKDKRSMNGENYATGRLDRSSGIIQDHGSGHRQDSCGSSKQGDDRNFDSREAESGRFTPKEFSATDLTYEHGSRYAENYNHMNDPSSGSSSSLRNISNHHNGDSFDAPTSVYMVPKFPPDVKGVKTRSGPSGYLKVKGKVENPAITAVRTQLGEHYREDGPLLVVEFDPLPPNAFESSMQDAVEETYHTEEAVLPVSATKICQNPKFGKGYEYNSHMASYYSNIDETSFKMRDGCDIPDSYPHKKFRQRTSLSNGSAYNPRSNSTVELPGVSDRDITASESREEYRMKPRTGVEVTRINSVSSYRHLLPHCGKARGEQAESWFQKHNDSQIPIRQNIDSEYSNLALKRKEYHNSGDNGLPRQIIEDGKAYAGRTVDENRVKIPFNNDLTAPKRTKEEFLQQKPWKTSSAVNNLPLAYQVTRSTPEMPSSFSEDEESAETSSSVD